MSTLSVKPEPSPSASPVSASYPGMRRGSYFEEGSFLSTSSAGSGSGNDSFSHAAAFDGMTTPSPSPPSGGMQYGSGQTVNYNQPMQAERQQNYGGQFYALPSPSQGMLQGGCRLIHLLVNYETSRSVSSSVLASPHTLYHLQITAWQLIQHAAWATHILQVLGAEMKLRSFKNHNEKPSPSAAGVRLPGGRSAPALHGRRGQLRCPSRAG